MNSLSAHLRSAESHDALPFHPSCPICVDHRLAGQIATRPIVPLRTQAALVAGLVAVSTTGPVAAAVAAEPDSTDDGTAPVAQTVPQDPASSSSYDPGGDTSDLTDQPQPTPAAPAATAAPSADPGDDTTPPDPAPTTDETDPTADPGDGSAPTVPATPTPTVATTSPPAPTTTSVTLTPPAAEPPVEAAPPADPALAPMPIAAPTAKPKPARSTAHRTRHHVRHVATRERRATRVAVSTPTVATVPSPAPTAVAAASNATGHQATPTDDVHVVQPGESLWAIASDMLGGDVSPAQIAREVHHLWQLNQDRIGTGDPDLVMAGTRLVLR